MTDTNKNTEKDKFQPIGRKLGKFGRTGDSPVALAIMNDIQTGAEREFTLKSGQKATFRRIVVPYEELESRTFVDQNVNGRDPSSLKEASLQDILRTLHLQQFFPVIGRVVEDGLIEILDGSRRRASALIAKVGLEMLVTNDPISASDARQLAADIQTAKEHSIRELGLRFEVLRAQGMSNIEIAKQEGLSNSTVTRAFQAASVAPEIVATFPVASELAFSDYKILLEVTNQIKLKGLDINEVITDVQSQIDENETALLPDEQKNLIVSLFKKSILRLKTPNPAKTTKVEVLHKFDDTRSYARRKTNAQNRTVVYEFARISRELQDKLDAAVNAILREELGDNTSAEVSLQAE